MVICGAWKHYQGKNEKDSLLVPRNYNTSNRFEASNMLAHILKGEEQELANTNHELLVKLSKEPQNWEYALIRTVGIKSGVNETSKCACS